MQDLSMFEKEYIDWHLSKLNEHFQSLCMVFEKRGEDLANLHFTFDNFVSQIDNMKVNDTKAES